MFAIKVDTNAGLWMLSELQQKQIPFAVKSALNSIANDAQKAERDHISASFKIRRPWVLQGVYISKADRATKDSWCVTIKIQGDRDFLNRFETGETKFPLHSKWLWIPNPDVFKNQVIPASSPLAPKNLNFQRSAGGEMQGDNRTFMVKGKKGPLVLQRMSSSAKGVAQRIGEGFRTGAAGRDAAGRFTKGSAANRLRRGGVRMLYILVSRAKLPVRLEFVSTITNTVNAGWETTLQGALDYALATAKP